MTHTETDRLTAAIESRHEEVCEAYNAALEEMLAGGRVVFDSTRDAYIRSHLDRAIWAALTSREGRKL